MGSMKKGVDMAETAFSWLRSLPRVSLDNLRQEPGLVKRIKRGRGRYGGKTHGCGQKSNNQRQRYTPVGFEGSNLPFFLKMPKEPYYANCHRRREYLPLSLLTLQKFIDTDRIDPTRFIDLAALCQTGLINLKPEENHFGIQLTDEGINKFSAKIDIEVQFAPEHVIAAIEKAGGSITAAYYDIHSVIALRNPKKLFEKGEPIPKRMLPPADAIDLYTDPKRRGYLANPQDVEYERHVLAQKYGYEVVERKPPIRKDPLQIFFGLEPGWIINLKDKTILKPKNPEIVEFYNS